MAVYVISEVEVRDPALADTYRALAQESIALYGGRYIVRGGAVEAIEGEWPAHRRVVVVEFPSMETARAWYGSAEYAAALRVRATALTRRRNSNCR